MLKKAQCLSTIDLSACLERLVDHATVSFDHVGTHLLPQSRPKCSWGNKPAAPQPDTCREEVIAG